MREIVLDTETTGVDPLSGHRVVEIGCVELHSGVPTGENFHTYLNPERDMPDEAFRIHGLSGDFLRDKPVFAEIVDKFIDFIADSQLVIHNASFDMRFVNAELERVGFAPLPMSRALDTVQVARKKFPGSPASLDALCRRFNIDLSARTKHGALLDAELLAEVYLELLGGRQSALGLDNKAQGNATVDIASNGIERKNNILAARVFEISAEECEDHAKFVEKIKNALWKADA
ncbi:MAG: DNA polymerase III subunit epsilon [Alphaproteobacteria bacterium]